MTTSSSAPARSGAPSSLEAARQRALTTLKFSRSMLTGMLKDFPEDKAAFQPAPTDNHLLWTLGHLASTYGWFLGLVGGKPYALPDGYDKSFGMGAKPVADAAAYPPIAELRRHFDAAFDAFIAAVESLPEPQLSAVCASDSHGFARDRLDVVEKAAWHEGWHSGQVSSIRRALGLKPLM